MSAEVDVPATPPEHGDTAPAQGPACPRCGAVLGPTQDWCLSCGAAARTSLAAPPNWRLPATVLMTLAALAVIALIAAFVVATDDDEPLVRTAPSAPVAPPVP